jgi:hypothetical protein
MTWEGKLKDANGGKAFKAALIKALTPLADKFYFNSDDVGETWYLTKNKQSIIISNHDDESIVDYFGDGLVVRLKDEDIGAIEEVVILEEENIKGYEDFSEKLYAHYKKLIHDLGVDKRGLDVEAFFAKFGN